MKLKLNYGIDKKQIVIDNGKCLRCLEPIASESSINEKEIVSTAIHNPISSKPLERFIEKGDRLLIVIPDKTRLSRLNIVLPIVLKIIKDSGVKRENIKIIFANGSHAGQSENEKIEILGKKIYSEYEIFEHNAYDDININYYGKTEYGTKVYLNKILKSVDKIITIGAFSHHYFAGFGGGAKMLLPGLAYYKTIEQNHKRSIVKGSLNKNCMSGVLKNNPVYEDLSCVAELLLNVYSICLMLDEKGKIAAAKSGDILKAHKSLTKLINDKYRIPIKRKADMVVCSAGGYPKDINIIQTHKSINNAFQAVKEKGAIVCFAQCKDGIGSKTFMDWFGFSKKELISRVSKHYSLNAQTAISIMEKSKKTRIYLVSEINRDDVVKMGMIPVNSFEEAYAKEKEYLNSDFKYYVIPNSSLTSPFFRDI